MHYMLNFHGYWVVGTFGVASYSGVYCVYAFTPDQSYLLYIGEANNIEARIANHERRSDWILSANGHPLYFNAAAIEPIPARLQAEAAMINYHKPLRNSEYINNFPYTTTTVTVNGANANLMGRFTVYTN